jgi:6-phosphogluconolactonase
MKTAPCGVVHFSFPGLLLVALTACGGGGYGGGGGGGGGGGATYTIGGMVTGLTGSGLVLQNNGGGDLTVSAAGAFTFTAGLAYGAAYAVTVKTQPSSPTQNCVVTNGSGTVGTANVTNVAVVCTDVGRFAYAANAGDNTLSVYAIDAATGALTAVGTPVATGTSPYERVARMGSTYTLATKPVATYRRIRSMPRVVC